MRVVAFPVLVLSVTLGGCGVGDVLSVPPPASVVASSSLQNRNGAEGLFYVARGGVFQAFAAFTGVANFGGLLTDEFAYSGFNATYSPANIDARITDISGTAFDLGSGGIITPLLNARSQLLIAEGLLQEYEPASGQAKAGEALALVGYAELLMAESLCAGVPLSYDQSGGGFVYGSPLTTDSLLGVAEAHFEAALAHAHGDPTVEALASVGLGRTLLDRGQYATAASAVQSVATDFVYLAELDPGTNSSFPDFYQIQLEVTCGLFNVSDHEGGNGLNFVTASDPRLALDSTVATTCDGGTWYYPTKFGNPSPGVPLATGVEARLIQAEAALAPGGTGPGAWAADVNALRAAAPGTYLALGAPMAPLTADSTTGANGTMQVNVMFRERAFWLFGTGTRLGDLRRLIRQYGRDAETVFPTGTYVNGENPNLPRPLPNYGTDVSLRLPTQQDAPTTNPNYRGCTAGANKA